MTATPILAAHRWPSNAHLIEDVARLGYLPGHVLDATYGRGNWWTRWAPDRLTAIDSHPDKARDARADFRALPFRRTFDAAAFDPPYISPGGRTTSTIPSFLDAYGIDAVASSPDGVRTLIAAGLAELRHVVNHGGIVIVKAKDYVTSGNLYAGAHYALTDALALGYQLVDRFEHVGDPGPQPTNRSRICPACGGDSLDRDGVTDCTACNGTGRIASVQHHARRNLSTLLVLRTPPATTPSLF